MAQYSEGDVSTFEIRKIKEHDCWTSYDFFIDEVYLPDILGIGSREGNLMFGNCDLDCFEADSENQSHNIDIIKSFVAACLGRKELDNQFGTNRIVLYRCHCGCDYCGVISLVLKIDDEYVYWTDIRYEHDHVDFEWKTEDKKFIRADYELEFEKYLNQLPGWFTADE